MTRSTKIQIAVGLAVLVILGQSLYTVSETEQVILTQFGEPVGGPGRHAGTPLQDTLHPEAQRLREALPEWDGNPNQVPTRDKRFIWVDTYARWRITDPLLFFQRLRDERGAQSRLDDILDGETRNAVARHDLIELVRSSNRDPDDVPIESEEEAVILEEIERGRQEITGDILATAAERTADLGIELLDLRLKPDRVRRRGSEGRVRADDRRAAADRRAIPVRGGRASRRGFTASASASWRRSSPRRTGRPRSYGAKRMPRRPESMPTPTTATPTSTRSRSRSRPTSRRWIPRRSSFWGPTASCSASLRTSADGGRAGRRGGRLRRRPAARQAVSHPRDAGPLLRRGAALRRRLDEQQAAQPVVGSREVESQRVGRLVEQPGAHRVAGVAVDDGEGLEERPPDDRVEAAWLARRRGSRRRPRLGRGSRSPPERRAR